MAKANPYSDADQPRFELLWSVMMMLVLLGGAWSGDCSFPSTTSGSRSFDAPCAVRHPLSCVHDCESC
jgi:hypothetical protein